MTTTNRARPRSGLLTAALDYAERGWHVFPLRPGTKKPAVPGHPAHLCDHTDRRCHHEHAGWEQRATTDPIRIEAAWTHRRYGIGIATGPSCLVVVDLDIPKVRDHPTGAQHLAHLEHAHGRRLPATFTVATPRGGQHRYYRAPRHGPALANTASRVAPYIDTRAAGGYVVAPPTGTSDGRYRITDNRPPARLPDWFAQLLTPPPPAPSLPAPASNRDLGLTHISDALDRYVTAAIDGELHRLATAEPGTRNNTLFTVAVALGQLVGAGLIDHHHAHQQLLDAAGGHITAGAYSPHQALTTIASGLHRGAQQPRRLPNHLTPQDTRP